MSATHWREGLQAAALKVLPGRPMHRAALGVLLLLAAVLRLWDLPHIPYTHDEISALIRIYPSLGETLRTGVIALDTHPPGVQVFEWAWTRLFGMGEAAVKLPFILLSLAALLLLYRFAYAWCGANVALLLTALLATLQYTVMYGQIARPYAAGLFTTALLADQLTRFLGTGSRRALIGTAVAVVLSAYTHHFALLLAALMVLTGALWILPAQRKAYWIACGAAALAYLPNVPIFLKQLGAKGLDQWLAPPTAMWVPDYLWWLAHCSVGFAAVWALLLAGSAALRIRHRGSSGPVWAITLLWGLLPLLVGYAYSVWRAPVLQYSVVLFSFPYLLLGALAGLRHLRAAWLLPVAFATAAVAVFTLITERRHYDIFYTSRYAAITEGIIAAQAVSGRMALLDGPDRMVDFYLRHWQVDPAQAPYFSIHDRSAAWVDSLLAASGASSVFFGSTAGGVPEHAARIQAAFPFLERRKDMEEGQWFLFSARPVEHPVDDHPWRSLLTPEAVSGQGWAADADLPLQRDTTAAGLPLPARWDLSGREYGLLFDMPIYQLAAGDNAVLEARMDVQHAEGTGLRLVVELMDGDRSTFYRNQPFHGGQGPAQVFCAIPLSDLPGHGRGQRLRAYAWNEGGGTAHVAAMELRVREGNPWLYGFFQPLKGPLKYP